MDRGAAGVRIFVLLLTAIAAICCSEEAPAPEELYALHCASCHGEDGRGDPRRRDLDAGLDLTTSELVLSGADGLIYRSIAYGFEGMPAFSHKLSLEQMQALTRYTLTFDPNNAP